jgi:hypothetical protein
VTQDAAVKVAAWKNFEAFDVLNQVTGIPGYSARSFVKRTDLPPQPNWYAYTLLLNLYVSHVSVDCSNTKSLSSMTIDIIIV